MFYGNEFKRKLSYYRIDWRVASLHTDRFQQPVLSSSSNKSLPPLVRVPLASDGDDVIRDQVGFTCNFEDGQTARDSSRGVSRDARSKSSDMSAWRRHGY